MTILHIVMNRDEASGVNTFVRQIDAELNGQGVTSEILAEGDPRSVDRLDESGHPDIVHIHGLWRPFFHRVAVWARNNHIPVVWSTHGMTAPWSMRHKRWKKLLAWCLYQRHDLKRAAFIHSTSENEVKWNESLGFKSQCLIPLGTHLPHSNIPPFKHSNIPPFPPSSHSNIQTFPHSNIRTLLFVGRIYPVKAIDRLIAAFCQAEPKNWNLRIVGPDQAGTLEALCASVPLRFREAVQFVGPKFGADLEAEYWNCDCLALVSHTENFGATVVDAMAHCRPVITSTNTPWREVVDAKCGWWVDNDVTTLAKAIGELMALSDAQRTEMGLNGRRLVEAKYTWSAVGKAMLAAYRGVLKETVAQ